MANPTHAIWYRVRAPFPLPEACHKCTRDDWEVYDIDKAGCRVCGRLHLCTEGQCPGTLEDDHLACEITGCWVRFRNFQQGYTENAMPSVSAEAPMPKQWVEEEHVMRWLHTLLHSDTARRCFDREIQRVHDKASAAFARAAKARKLEGLDPDVLGLFAQTRFVLGSLRIPAWVKDKRAFDELARACMKAILRFTAAFRRVLAPYVPPVKVDHFVIGLIYLLRTGIVMFDTLQVIPRIPALRRLLPMETCLKAHFRIPCKIITEVENITKIALKALDRRRIKALLNASQ